MKVVAGLLCAGSAWASQSMGLSEILDLDVAAATGEEPLGSQDHFDLVFRLEEAMKHFDEVNHESRRRVSAEVSYSYDMDDDKHDGSYEYDGSYGSYDYSYSDTGKMPSPRPTTPREVSPTPTPTPVATFAPSLAPTAAGVTGSVTFRGKFQVDVDGTVDQLNADEDFLFAMEKSIRKSANYNSTLNVTRDEIQDIGVTEVRRRSLKAAVVVEYTIIQFFSLVPGSTYDADSFSAMIGKKITNSIVQAINQGVLQDSITAALLASGSAYTVDVDEAGSVTLTRAAVVTYVVTTGSGKKKKKDDDDDLLILIIILVVCIPVGLVLIALIAMAVANKSSAVTPVAAAVPAGSKVAPVASY